MIQLTIAADDDENLKPCFLKTVRLKLRFGLQQHSRPRAPVCERRCRTVCRVLPLLSPSCAAACPASAALGQQLPSQRARREPTEPSTQI